MNYYGQYGQNILGRAPGGSAFGQVKANTVDPYVAALGGAKLVSATAETYSAIWASILAIFGVNQFQGTGGAEYEHEYALHRSLRLWRRLNARHFV